MNNDFVLYIFQNDFSKFFCLYIYMIIPIEMAVILYMYFQSELSNVLIVYSLMLFCHHNLMSTFQNSLKKKYCYLGKMNLFTVICT